MTIVAYSGEKTFFEERNDRKYVMNRTCFFIVGLLAEVSFKGVGESLLFL